MEKCYYCILHFALYVLHLARWAHQDLNLGPIDYESTALTN